MINFFVFFLYVYRIIIIIGYFFNARMKYTAENIRIAEESRVEEKKTKTTMG